MGSPNTGGPGGNWTAWAGEGGQGEGWWAHWDWFSLRSKSFGPALRPISAPLRRTQNQGIMSKTLYVNSFVAKCSFPAALFPHFQRRNSILSNEILRTDEARHGPEKWPRSGQA